MNDAVLKRNCMINLLDLKYEIHFLQDTGRFKPVSWPWCQSGWVLFHFIIKFVHQFFIS